MRQSITIAISLCLALILGSTVAQGSHPTMLADESLFTEGQRNTLQRDANLAQRAGVPITFVVQQGDTISADSATGYADQYRADYDVETSPGADDGIVFLIHWVAEHPEQSTVVYSAGESAFDTTGLSDETITEYIDKHVQPLLDNGQLFEANVYLMRFTRYTSLYIPPPVREITGVASVVKSSLAVVAPVLMAAGIVSMWRDRDPGDTRRWRIIAITLAFSAGLFALSVWTNSLIALWSTVGLLVSLAIWCLTVTRDRDEEPVRWRRLIPDIIIVSAVFAVSFGINMGQVEETSFDRDETRWISRAHYAVDLADPFGPTWQDYAVTVGQPPLGSIVIGIGMSLQGEDVRATGTWDYQYGQDWYRATGGYPTDDAITAARNTNAFIGALSTGAAYVLGRLLTNRIGGLAAAVFLAWHPLHIVLSTQALSDATFALLLLLALIAAWQFAAKPTWPRAIALGLMLGLGGSTKLTPLLLAPPLVVYGLIRLWLDRTENGKRAGWMLIAQPFIAFAAFVAIYPWTWVNPIERTWRLFSFRAGEMEAQTEAWPGVQTSGPLDALSRFGSKLTYTNSTSQKAIQYVYDWIGIDRTAVGVDLIFAAAGGVILLWIVAKRGLWTPQALVACLIVGELALLAIGMRADFYRYHLPVVMLASACISVSVGTAWSALARIFASRSQVADSSVSAEVAT